MNPIHIAPLGGEVSIFSKKGIFFSKTTNFEKRAFKNDFLHYFCSKMEVC